MYYVIVVTHIANALGTRHVVVRGKNCDKYHKIIVVLIIAFMYEGFNTLIKEFFVNFDMTISKVLTPSCQITNQKISKTDICFSLKWLTMHENCLICFLRRYTWKCRSSLKDLSRTLPKSTTSTQCSINNSGSSASA